MFYTDFSRKFVAIFLMIGVLWLSGMPSCAADNSAPAAGKILTGDELLLSDGHTVKLEGIKAPFPEPPELAEQSRRMLEKFIGAQAPLLENITTDRYGRLSAQAFVSREGGDKIWLQETMLREGLAFIYPPTGHEPNLAALFAAEKEARTAKRGMWANAFYADTPCTKAWKKLGHFAFISGTILKANHARDKIYLDFGTDWRKDFAIVIAAHDLAAFRKADIDPLAYEGKTIRVRGWVIRNAGPLITVTAPAQIEIISNP